MEKTITALFDTSEGVEAARDAARISGAAEGSVRVCRAIEPKPFAGKNTLYGIGAGAAVGTIVGLGAAFFGGAGLSAAGPVTGLIGGAALGAVIGGFLDLRDTGKSPESRWLFTVSMDESRTGAAARKIRRCGGEKIHVG